VVETKKKKKKKKRGPVVVVKKAVTGNEADSKDFPSPRGGGTWKRDHHSLFFFSEPLTLPWPPTIDLPNRVYFFHRYVLRDFLVLIDFDILVNIRLKYTTTRLAFLSMALYRIQVRFAARTCPVTRHKLVFHAGDVKPRVLSEHCLRKLRNTRLFRNLALYMTTWMSSNFKRLSRSLP
jgi:hypothetical protein